MASLRRRKRLRPPSPPPVSAAGSPSVSGAGSPSAAGAGSPPVAEPPPPPPPKKRSRVDAARQKKQLQLTDEPTDYDDIAAPIDDFFRVEEHSPMRCGVNRQASLEDWDDYEAVDEVDGGGPSTNLSMGRIPQALRARAPICNPRPNRNGRPDLNHRPSPYSLSGNLGGGWGEAGSGSESEEANHHPNPNPNPNPNFLDLNEEANHDGGDEEEEVARGGGGGGGGGIPRESKFQPPNWCNDDVTNIHILRLSELHQKNIFTIRGELICEKCEAEPRPVKEVNLQQNHNRIKYFIHRHRQTLVNNSAKTWMVTLPNRRWRCMRCFKSRLSINPARHQVDINWLFLYCTESMYTLKVADLKFYLNTMGTTLRINQLSKKELVCAVMMDISRQLG